jgi:hypothetical protein
LDKRARYAVLLLGQIQVEVFKHMEPGLNNGRVDMWGFSP